MALVGELREFLLRLTGLNVSASFHEMHPGGLISTNDVDPNHA